MEFYCKLECLVEKKWIAVFKVKVTAKIQNVNECLSGRDRLNR